MKVTLVGGRPAPESAIEALERGLGFPISAPFKEFVSQQDGAEPESNVFGIGPAEYQSGVRQFIPVAEILEERSSIEGFPADLYPVGYDDFGNYICINEEQHGEVCFWDHETGDLTKITDSFSDFIERLEPFDEDSVELDPKDVKSVWVHPDLLPFLKR